jgi:hypothetical protein
MAVGRLISPNMMAIIAITNNTWINPPTEYINTPSAHPITRITATIYNNEFMVDVLSLLFCFSLI